MTNFVFIAPPAAGKGTQSKMLVEEYGYIHISTGDLLREEVSKQTELGIQLEEIMSSGKLVDDEIVLTLLKTKLTSLVNEGLNFIIDGFPRTLNQATMLEHLFKELNIADYKVIYMNLNLDEAKNRVLGRLICPNCGKSFNESVEGLIPKVSGKCDSCSADLIKRSDDNEETFVERFNTYINNVKPILDFYSNCNKLINIDASKDAESIFKDIKTYVIEVK